MAKCKVVSGLTANTAERLILDAGAFFKNYDFETDTYDSAVASGKLIGATKGGGNFKAVPTFRKVEIDGMRGDSKGDKILESWDVMMGMKVVEIKSETLKDLLAISEIDTESNVDYEIITGRSCIVESDYIDNITWVGNLSGSEKLVIIQIFNALNTKGIEIGMTDKGEAVIDSEFKAHYDMVNNADVPFKIYYPKAVA